MSDPYENASALVGSYTNPSRFGSRHCRPLAIVLRKVAPTDLDPRALAALGRVELRAQDVEDIWAARERQAAPAVKGPRNAASVAWSTLNTALGCVAQLTRDPAGVEAAGVQGALFAEGVGFVLLDAHAMWGVGDRMLARIDADGLAPVIDRLVHPSLLRDVRTTHTQLGIATGLGIGVAVAPSIGSLAEARARFAYAVCDYARAASVGLDLSDREAVTRFANAMAPIDTYRITRSTDEDDTDATDAPSPVERGGGPPPPFGA